MGVLDSFFQQAQAAASSGTAIVGKCSASASTAGSKDPLTAKGNLTYDAFVPTKQPPVRTPPVFHGTIGKTHGDNNFFLTIRLQRQNVFSPSIPGVYEFHVDGANMGQPVSLVGVSDPVTGFKALRINEVEYTRTDAAGNSLTLTITIP